MTTCTNCGRGVEPEVRFCPHCGSKVLDGQKATDLIGRTLNDKYRVLSEIGSGSMGTVYLGEHIGLKKKVALKVLHPDLQVGDETLQRFQREGIAAGKFNHPNAIQIFDFDRASEGVFYLAMEYVEGRTLKQLLADEGPLPPAAALVVTRQVLMALAEAHRRGIIHRDLKPDNIMVVDDHAGDPVVKVLDFGMARLVDRPIESSLATVPGRIIGTPLYMAPEQAMGGEVDHRSDLYAVGLILYELVCGQPPFKGESITDLFFRRASEPVPSLVDSHPDLRVPAALDELLSRVLEKRRDDRYESAGAMLNAIDAIDLSAPAARPSAKPARAKQGRAGSAPGGPRVRPRIVLATVAMLLVAVLAVWQISRAGAPPPVPRVSMKAADRRSAEERRYVELLQAARDQLRTGNADDALAQVESALALSCKDSEAYLVRGEAYRQLGDDDTALADFREALNVDPAYAAAACDIGWIHADRGEYGSARDRFEQAAASDAASGEALAGQGAVRYLQRELESARGLLDRALELEPDNALAHEYRGRLLLDLDETDEAIKAFVEAKRHDHTSWIAFAGLGRAYLRTGRLDEAERQLVSAVELAPDAIAPLLDLASLLVEQERYDEALNRLQDVRLDDGRLHLLRGTALASLDRVDAAITALQRGLRTIDDAQARTLLGLLYHGQGRLDLAMDAYRLAIASDDDLASAHCNLGLALFAEERYEDAARELQAAVVLDGEIAFAHYGLGVLYMDYLGDDARAVEHLTMYVELDGSDERAQEWLTNLGG